MTLRERQTHRSNRAPAPLGATLNKSLVSYATAASAAGVAMLALAQTSRAEVVYTPANTPLVINTPVPLDLNHDGVADFQLSHHNSIQTASSCIPWCFEITGLDVSPAQAGNAVWATSSSVISHRNRPPRFRKGEKDGKKLEVAVPAPWGVLIAAPRGFQGSEVLMDFFKSFHSFSGSSTQSVGPWGKGKLFTGPYVGLKFMINGGVHYGWARIEVHADRLKVTARLTGYAYETVANRPIVTGLTHAPFDEGAEASSGHAGKLPTAEPASLGCLAEGAPGVKAWRATATLQ
jgi:hypothetical protein